MRVVARSTSVAKAREIVETGEIMVFVGPDFVVTVRHGDHGGLAGVRKRMDGTPANCALGPYAVLHAIADHVVDHYLEVTDLVENDIDAMEENVFSPTSETVTVWVGADCVKVSVPDTGT